MVMLYRISHSSNMRPIIFRYIYIYIEKSKLLYFIIYWKSLVKFRSKFNICFQYLHQWFKRVNYICKSFSFSASRTISSAYNNIIKYWGHQSYHWYKILNKSGENDSPTWSVVLPTCLDLQSHTGVLSATTWLRYE